METVAGAAATVAWTPSAAAAMPDAARAAMRDLDAQTASRMGVTTVVPRAITTHAAYSRWSSTPLDRPRLAATSATSPRAIMPMPTPTDASGSRPPRRAPEAAADDLAHDRERQQDDRGDEHITRGLEVDGQADGYEEYRHAERLTRVDQLVTQAVGDMGARDRDTRHVGTGDGGKAAPLLEHPRCEEDQSDHARQPTALELQLMEQCHKAVTEDIDEGAGSER